MRSRKPSRVPQVALPHSGMGQGKNSHGANNGFLILQHNWNTNGRGLALRSQSFACLKWSTGVTRPIRVCYQRSLLRSWVEKEACRDTLGRRNPLPDFPPHNSNLGGKPRFTRQSETVCRTDALISEPKFHHANAPHMTCIWVLYYIGIAVILTFVQMHKILSLLARKRSKNLT